MSIILVAWDDNLLNNMPLILAWYPCVEGSYMSTNPTRNRNNEFILDNLYCAKNMADFERRQLEIRLEFVR